MGQRHQLFVIARTLAKAGQQYRSLAAVHHQWLYGMSALRQCLRIVRIFSAEVNRTAIQQELAFASEYYATTPSEAIEALKKRNGHDTKAPCPFPFITTSLILGASCNPDTGSCHTVHEMPFGMSCDGGHNDDGITVIDITNLDDVRYCFVAFGCIGSARDQSESDSESERVEVPRHTPLDGWTYLRAYYDDSESIVQSAIEIPRSLERFKVVDISSLADCWPESGWKVECGPATQPLESFSVPPVSTSSLKFVAKTKLLDEFLAGNENDTSLLDDPLLIPGFKQDMLRYLSEHDDALCKSPIARQLLAKAFAGERVVDLTPFRDMPPVAVRALLESDALKAAKVLNLSGIKAVSDSEIVETLGSIKYDLDELYLLARPDRESEDPLKAVNAILSNQLASPKRLLLGAAFSQGLRTRPWFVPERDDVSEQMRAISLAANGNRFWSFFPVIQLLYKGPDELKVINRDEPWLTNLFLGDAFLSPERFVTGIIKIIQMLLIEPVRSNGLGIEFEIPLAFASASSHLGDLGSTEVNPLPAEAYFLITERYYKGLNNGLVSKMRDLNPESWTAVLIHDVQFNDVPRVETNCFKLALVRSKRVVPADAREMITDLEDLEVVNLEKFVEMTSPRHAMDVKNAIAGLNKYAGDLALKPGQLLVSSMTDTEVDSTIAAFLDKAAKMKNYSPTEPNKKYFVSTYFYQAKADDARLTWRGRDWANSST